MLLFPIPKYHVLGTYSEICHLIDKYEMTGKHKSNKFPVVLKVKHNLTIVLY